MAESDRSPKLLCKRRALSWLAGLAGGVQVPGTALAVLPAPTLGAGAWMGEKAPRLDCFPWPFKMRSATSPDALGAREQKEPEQRAASCIEKSGERPAARGGWIAVWFRWAYPGEVAGYKGTVKGRQRGGGTIPSEVATQWAIPLDCQRDASGLIRLDICHRVGVSQSKYYQSASSNSPSITTTIAVAKEEEEAHPPFLSLQGKHRPAPVDGFS